MKKLLVCTIMRNCRAHLETYNAQLDGLRKQLKGQYEVWVSVYENDSTDGTAEWLSRARDAGQLHAHFFPDQQPQSTITTETLGTRQYGSVWDVQRLKQLAAARQKCLDQMGPALATFDKVAYIEVDCTWDPVWCKELVLAEHPRAAGIGEPDIYSGWSLRSLAHPKESTFLYDDCATRAGPDNIRWDIGEANGTWRGKSLVPTGLTGFHANSLHSVWSTFNCFCVYSAKPFIEGARWGYTNRRIDPSGIWLGDEAAWLECDTVAICETFRARGHSNILLNTNCLIRHA